MAATFPPEATSSIDWTNVGFQVRDCNGHVETTYSTKTKTWSPPKFVKSPFLPMHGMAPALNYGQQCYEGLKAFRHPDGRISVFRPNKNAVRMQHSAAVISMPAVPEDLFIQCVKAAVARNAEFVPPVGSGAAMYVRPLLMGSGAKLALQPTEEYLFCVFVMPTGVYHGVHPVEALILEDFDRAAPLGVGSAKVGGNYAPVLRHSDRAYGEGFGITLHLDSKTHSEVDEFSTSGFIGVRKSGESITVVVPDSTAVIDSVTSDSILGIARHNGWTVEKRAIKYGEIPEFTEVMAAGTAAALVPIRSITRRIAKGDERSVAGKERVEVVQDGEKITFLGKEIEDAGPICLQLLKQLQGIQFGKIPDPFEWNAFVTSEDVAAVKDE